MNETNIEYVYCMTNKSFDSNLLKVGWTTNNPNKRARQLYTTGVPTPFNIEFIIKSRDGRTLESRIHSILSSYRENNSREFFRIELQELRRILIEKMKLTLEEPEPIESSVDYVHEVCERKTFERCSQKFLKLYNNLPKSEYNSIDTIDNMDYNIDIKTRLDKFRYVP